MELEHWMCTLTNNSKYWLCILMITQQPCKAQTEKHYRINFSARMNVFLFMSINESLNVWYYCHITFCSLKNIHILTQDHAVDTTNAKMMFLSLLIKFNEVAGKEATLALIWSRVSGRLMNGSPIFTPILALVCSPTTVEGNIWFFIC